ncbi:IS1595 family transposase [Cohnella sp. JJ-181]|uniref:IS1595 family transposase n=1 Tax=Cohnella rhizoplanae TaxID=2974897 RepID=UPI0022FF85FE|nr:IS1595 family transposase [Cohnella sp. JJ-181]CAI6035543.1 hypothetical protein COHCIP112018_00878 [Cohnella sp. JJ-181]
MSVGQSIRKSIPFFTEDECAAALFAAKWSEGFRCPRCAHSRYYDVSSRGRRLFECRSCSHQTSLTAGTVFEGTRTPLTKWFTAMYLMQFGISAVLLAEWIQVTYKTAWLINHKLRHAIGERDQDRPLGGNLQLLGEYYGYEYHRYFSDKLAQGELKPQPIVIGASLDETGEVVQLKMKAVDGPEGDCVPGSGSSEGDEAMELFLQNHAANRRESDHLEVLKRSHRGRKEPHLAWLGVVRWLAWTFGGIGPKHLQAYLNEYCFRYMYGSRALPALIANVVTTRTITYRSLVGARSGIRPIRWAFRRPVRSRQQAG